VEKEEETNDKRGSVIVGRRKKERKGEKEAEARGLTLLIFTGRKLGPFGREKKGKHRGVG